MTNMQNLILLYRTLKQNSTRLAYLRELIKRHKALLAYVFLAVAIAYVIADERAFQAESRKREVVRSAESREQLRQATRHAVVLGCERDNQSHKILRERIAENFEEVRRFVEEGTLTEAQAERSNRNTIEAINDFPDRPCQLIGDRFVRDSNGLPRTVILQPPQELVMPEAPNDARGTAVSPLEGP